jgi:hypothetical protein
MTLNIILLILLFSQEIFVETKTCNSNVCIKDAAKIISWMNASVPICENFSEHICGTLTHLVRILNFN